MPDLISRKHELPVFVYKCRLLGIESSDAKSIPSSKARPQKALQQKDRIHIFAELIL